MRGEGATVDGQIIRCERERIVDYLDGHWVMAFCRHFSIGCFELLFEMIYG